MRTVFFATMLTFAMATPVFAADADPHAGHHPEAAAAPAPRPDPAPDKKTTAQAGMACPMMQDGAMNKMMAQKKGGGMGSAGAMDCPMMKAQPDSKSNNH